MKTFLTVVFLLFASLAYAQIPECRVAIVADPMGPFPCSVTYLGKDSNTKHL